MKHKINILLFLILILTVPVFFLVKGTTRTEPKQIAAVRITPTTQENVLGEESTPMPTQLPSITPQIKKNVTTRRLGFAVSDYSNKNGEISTLQQTVGKNISTISLFKQFGLDVNSTVNNEDLTYVKAHSMKLLIAWEPWNPQEGMHQSVDYLTDITNGKQDEYIKNFARSLKAYGAPVIIRFGHEMNGDWYPWGHREHEYIQAYQRIVTLFRNEGVTNVEWMWSINANPLQGIGNYYPGSEYVDIIGIDGFNFGTTQANNSWRTFQDIFLPAYTAVTKYGKPIIISETASAELGGNKAQWIENMFSSLSQTMPNVQELIWFNFNKETDWRINSSPASLTAFTENL
jgi:beta-mannanase